MRSGWTALAAGATALLLGTAAQAADDRNGRLDTTDELVTACSEPADAPDRDLYTAFCHGYMVGVYHFAEALARGPDPVRLVCVGDPKPDVASATQAFVAWAKANPQHAADPPVESVMRWAMAAYPCP
jgi:hypothetical protein